MVHIIVSFRSEKYNFSIEGPQGVVLKQLVREFNKDIKKRGVDKSQIISDYLKVLQNKVIELNLDFANSPIIDQNYQVFLKFLDLIEHDYQKTRSVTKYSQRLGITTRKLTAICVQFRRKTPKKLINDHLIFESKRLLKLTSHSVKEVSYLLGFRDPYQFSKFFKTRVNVTPSYYQKI